MGPLYVLWSLGQSPHDEAKRVCVCVYARTRMCTHMLVSACDISVGGILHAHWTCNPPHIPFPQETPGRCYVVFDCDL